METNINDFCNQFFSCFHCVNQELITEKSNGIALPCAWCITNKKCMYINIKNISATCPNPSEISFKSHSCPSYSYYGYYPLLIIGSILLITSFVVFYISIKEPSWKNQIIEEVSDGEGNTYMTMHSPLADGDGTVFHQIITRRKNIDRSETCNPKYLNNYVSRSSSSFSRGSPSKFHEIVEEKDK